MIPRRLIFLTFALTWALFLPYPTPAQTPSGVTGYTTGGTIHYDAASLDLTIPEEYMVVDIEPTSDRLVVTAYSIIPTDRRNPRYRSEVWVFPRYRGKGEDGTRSKIKGFEDRQVLVAMDTWDGESKKLCLFTVNCPQATAVYVDGWENGHTLLFDRGGQEIPVDWPTSKIPGSRTSKIDFIRPVLWLQEWQPDYRCRLVCIVSEHGDDKPLILLYDLQAAEIEMLPWKEALGSLGYQIINGLWNIH